MRGLRVVFVLCLAALVMGSAFSAKADTKFSKRSILTFSQPVELPGNVVLPAGTYTFTVMETFGNRHIVQVFNKEQTHVYATILAIPNYRVKPTNKTVIRFSETAAGAPNAVKEWFYPGNNFGDEFVYPKKRAVELAQASNEPVPATPVELAPAPTVQELEKTPVKVEEPSGAEVEVAEVFPSTPRDVDQLTRTPLPKTASMLPLFGLTGLLLLGTGTVLWIFSKRAA